LRQLRNIQRIEILRRMYEHTNVEAQTLDNIPLTAHSLVACVQGVATKQKVPKKSFSYNLLKLLGCTPCLVDADASHGIPM